MRGLLATLAALPAGVMVVVALLLAAATTVAAPRDARACSCVAPMPLADYAAEGSVILSGRVLADDGEGVQVGVETWFAGPGAAPVVRIGGDFGNGASCGVGSRPPVGSRWIWVAWRPEPENPVEGMLPRDLGISICAPFGDLATPEGQALLLEAQTTFGGSAPEPAASAQAEPSAAADAPLLVAGGGVLIAGALVLLVAILVARRRPSGGTEAR
jgi:hypothetical protein